MTTRPEIEPARYQQELEAALTGAPAEDVVALQALLEEIQEQHLPALDRPSAERGRALLAQQAQTAAALRARGLGRPLWEWRDAYEQALRALLAAGQGVASRAGLQALAQTLQPSAFLPAPGVATLASVGMSSWYWVGGGGLTLRQGPLEVVEPRLAAWRQQTGRPAGPVTADELLDYASDVYCADTWADLAWRRPSLIAAVTGLPAATALERLVRADFVQRQFPGVTRLLAEEIGLG